jgi:hypothetical protein
MKYQKLCNSYYAPAFLVTMLSSVGSFNIPASQIIASNLFPEPTAANATLDVYNVTARITTDIEFRCLDDAIVMSSVKHKLFPLLYYWQFDRSFGGFDPTGQVCSPAATATHPFGDPTLPYFRCA